MPDVIFDRDGILVLYKPPHWTMTTTAVMPRATSIQAWLCDSLGRRYPFLRENPLQAGLVQRLDVETSGPVVVATQRWTFEKIWQLRAGGRFYREYCVLLHGLVPLEHCCGTLNYNLDTERTYTKVCKLRGRPARTRYQAIGAFFRRAGCGASASTVYYTLIRARIMTGCTHQIRVHLRELARQLRFRVCGVVGDYRYLPRADVEQDWNFCPRVFLHARVLRFPLPGRHGGNCRVDCELPSDLAQVLRALTPDEEMTAKFMDVPDFLQFGDRSEAPVRVVILADRTPSCEPRLDRSRSPSHWRPDAANEESDASAFSPAESPARSVNVASRSPSVRQRIQSDSEAPSHWCPSPSRDASLPPVVARKAASQTSLPNKSTRIRQQGPNHRCSNLARMRSLSADARLRMWQTRRSASPALTSQRSHHPRGRHPNRRHPNSCCPRNSSKDVGVDGLQVRRSVSPFPLRQRSISLRRSKTPRRRRLANKALAVARSLSRRRRAAALKTIDIIEGTPKTCSCNASMWEDDSKKPECTPKNRSRGQRTALRTCSNSPQARSGSYCLNRYSATKVRRGSPCRRSAALCTFEILENPKPYKIA